MYFFFVTLLLTILRDWFPLLIASVFRAICVCYNLYKYFTIAMLLIHFQETRWKLVPQFCLATALLAHWLRLISASYFWGTQRSFDVPLNTANYNFDSDLRKTHSSFNLYALATRSFDNSCLTFTTTINIYFDLWDWPKTSLTLS